jgi:hypothetical protein
VTVDDPGDGRRTDEATALTAFQVEVSRLFFSLPASAGFLLAGGAALAVQHLTQRPTQDLDFFTRRGGGDVSAARDSLVTAAIARGWVVRMVQDTETFCRLVLSGPEELLVDLALDSPPLDPEATSSVGPTFSLAELAGRKLIALFGRGRSSRLRRRLRPLGSIHEGDTARARGGARSRLRPNSPGRDVRNPEPFRR